MRAAGCEVLTGHTVVGSHGRKRVTGLVVAPVGRVGAVGTPRTLTCDCVGLSGGWTPAVHLFSQSRGKLSFDATIDAFVPGASVQAERSAGAARGTYQLSACLEEGWAAGAAAAGRQSARAFAASATRTGFRPVRIMPGCDRRRRGRAFVDLQNDVTAKDIGLAVREGFEAIEHVKRYTTTGMATDQGKTSNMAALGLVAEALDRPVPEVGHDDVPVALYAGDVRRVRRSEPRQAVRSGAHDADARLGRRPRGRVRGRGPVETRALLSSARRGHARRRDPRMQGRARASRHLRRLDAGQDRGRGPGRGRVPGPHLYGLVRQARAGPLPLWPDAEGRRLHPRRRRRRPPRRRPLSRDDDDRRRRPRAAAHGGLLADGVVGAEGLSDVDHRAVRGHRVAGAEGARRARAVGGRDRPVERGVSAHVGARGCCLRHPVPAVPRLLHGRARLRDQRAVRLRRGRVGGLDRARRGPRPHALWHRGNARAARREGLHHRRPGDGRHGHA